MLWHVKVEITSELKPLCENAHTSLWKHAMSLLLWDRCGWRYFYFPSLLMHYFTYLHPSAVNQNDNFYDLISGEQSAGITEKWFLAVKWVVDGTEDWETPVKHVWHFMVIQWDSDKVYRIKPYKFWPCASCQTLHRLVAVQCWSYFKVTSNWALSSADLMQRPIHFFFCDLN